MAPHVIPISELPLYDRTNLPESGLNYSEGAVFLIDKPAGWTSFDVVRFLRNRIRIKKTGHAGTLDPSATGLLILCAGKATKSISELQNYPKRYLAEVKLGESTPSQDTDTEPDEFASYDHIDRTSAEDVIRKQFSGTILQTPPMYSAIWKNGKRLYQYARRGEVVEREPREVEIQRIDITSFTKGKIELDVTCSKGTYIRTLAHDAGIALGTRACLAALRRVEIGPFGVDHALDIEKLREIFKDASPYEKKEQ